MKWCKHPGCAKKAIVYKRDGIKVVACKEHFDILVEYIKETLRTEGGDTSVQVSAMSGKTCLVSQPGPGESTIVPLPEHD